MKQLYQSSNTGGYPKDRNVDEGLSQLILLGKLWKLNKIMPTANMAGISGQSFMHFTPVWPNASSLSYRTGTIVFNVILKESGFKEIVMHQIVGLWKNTDWKICCHVYVIHCKTRQMQTENCGHSLCRRRVMSARRLIQSWSLHFNRTRLSDLFSFYSSYSRFCVR